MGRRPPATNLDGQNQIHAQGSYDQVLRETCSEAVFDVDFHLSQEATDPLLRAAHEVLERERLNVAMEQQRGRPVYCQLYQLGGCARLPASWRGEQLFTVGPDDVITLRRRHSKRQHEKGSEVSDADARLRHTDQLPG